ncbi:MAG: elongation factor EF-2 [Candidatus Altiarchaeales archaeon A3]|nr:MAG: elongation factor EF-2 [Candidatus Altiarchaeales archaeon A3]
MGRAEQLAEKAVSMMQNRANIRNMAIVAHIDHGKTTLTTNLLAGAGLISESALDKDKITEFAPDSAEAEQRGITIDSANVSITHNYEGKEYLINLIDTPGHVDFGGNVTRAMRAVDCCIVVCCAVEGIMPQTKTVLNQALNERVKPVLFINKTDRLITELKLTPEELQKRFIKIISAANAMIKLRQPKGVDWTVDVAKGTVAFGSAKKKWAINVPYMKKTGITFKDIIDACNNEKQEELAKKSPLNKIVMDMVISALPAPIDAQKVRIDRIWRGDADSETVAKDMQTCNPDGKLAIMIFDITYDKHAGEIAIGRIYSGTVHQGDEVYSVGNKVKMRVQQLGLYMGPQRVNVAAVPSGNIVALSGISNTFVGDTIASEMMTAFEEIKHYSDPVVTKAFEPKNIKDIGKLVEVLNGMGKEDPTLKIKIDEQTGENLVAGMGELHLEIVEHRLRDRGVEVITSPPIVVYRETINSSHGEVEGKSPNKHNKFYLAVEPLEEELYKAVISGELKGGRRKSRSKDLRALLVSKGIKSDEAASIIDIFKGNVLMDLTKGLQHLDETLELVFDAFEQVMEGGPLAKEPMIKMKVTLHDAVLHEDAIHRGPAQIYPAVRNPIYAGILMSKPTFYEPMQDVFIQIPHEYIGAITSVLQARRGQILNILQEEELTTIEGRIPISETFGITGDIRGASEGHALWSSQNSGYDEVPRELQEKIIGSIRKRKGLSEQVPKSEEYMERQ